MSPTIFAPITGRGGAVTVLRLAGPQALAITQSLTQTLPAPRRAALKTLIFQGNVLDHALVTVFPGPNSFTGEDSAEFSLHGGRAVLAALSSALTTLGARYAEPGEFSRRAHANGKLDLLEAEAMADLIASETEAQRRLALEGGAELQKSCASWRATLLAAMAQQEALIDFPDEDLPPEVEASLLAQITALRDEMATVLAAAPAAARLREGLEFVIIGPPNAGKSSLINALAGEDIAIVSAIPGTTRDILGTRIDLAGIPVHLSDTAGLRASTDPIEAEGVARATARAQKADLILALAAPDQDFPPTPADIPTLYIRTKSDLLPASLRDPGQSPGDPESSLLISIKTGSGMATLRQTLNDHAIQLTDTHGAAALARPRQIACLRDTAEALTRALATTEPELRGEDLRAAAHALARLTGAIGVEEILSAVFSGFCIGK